MNKIFKWSWFFLLCGFFSNASGENKRVYNEKEQSVRSAIIKVLENQNINKEIKGEGLIITEPKKITIEEADGIYRMNTEWKNPAWYEAKYALSIETMPISERKTEVNVSAKIELFGDTDLTPKPPVWYEVESSGKLEGEFIQAIQKVLKR